MSLVDFTQEACNHGSFNVAVMAVGEASGQLYTAVTDQLSSLPPIPLKDEGTLSTATVVVFPRFLPILNRPLPRWATDGQRWEEFAPHKQVCPTLLSMVQRYKTGRETTKHRTRTLYGLKIDCVSG